MKRKQNIHLGRLYFSIIQSDTPWLNITLEMIMNAGAAVSLRNNKAEYKTCTHSLLLTHALNQTHRWPTNSLERQRDALKQNKKTPLHNNVYCKVVYMKVKLEYLLTVKKIYFYHNC